MDNWLLINFNTSHYNGSFSQKNSTMIENYNLNIFRILPKIILKIFKFLFYSLIIVVFALLVRIFIIEPSNIPTDSMERTLLIGDGVIVSKLHYGARLPRSPYDIPWIKGLVPNTGFLHDIFDNSIWEYYRFPGFSRTKHDDVIIFINPDYKEEFLIKRCVGLAGDTFSIIIDYHVIN